jgi:hypothetical protein
VLRGRQTRSTFESYPEDLAAGAVAAPVLALTGCAGAVTRPGDLSRLRIMAR